MKSNDLSYSFSVDKSPEEVFSAIKDVRSWWSQGIEGKTGKVGDVFTYRHRDMHYSTQKLVEVEPDAKLVWLVTDARLTFTKNQREWEGTKITFEISRNGKKTDVRFTHVGLSPDHECFNACSEGWGFYIKDSLRKLITTGKGDPDTKANKRPAQEQHV